MRQSDSVAQVAAALAAAQGVFPIIPKDRTVTVRMKSGGSYTFAYAPLDTILSCVRPALAANGLALVQGVVSNQAGAEFVRTTLMHSSGEWLSNDQPLFSGSGENASQAFGGGTTYARRYGVTALLCLAADDDNDASDAQAERPRAAAPKPAQRPAYPDADFAENLPKWRAAIEAGKRTADEIIAMVESRGALTGAQRAAICGVGGAE